jgi:hypothetical protein
MPWFSFTIQSINIQNTRSKHLDTDYVALTFKLGSLAPEFEFQFLGNINSGVHQAAPSLGIEIEIGLEDQFTLNYLIVNAGSTTSAKAQAALEQAGAAWASGQGPASTNFVGALEDSNQPWFNGQLGSILNSKSCDGMVAAEQDHLSYGDLVSLVSNGPHTVQTHHSGVRSPSGCGPNSQYTVTWVIAENTQVIV